ncbi:hypothetical protein D3880_15635 [Pseudomonas cavernae]|uniref:Cobalamin ABC transporter n=1 Tax=Pseudomonas cavernae TaxID=2320867 RepID=A0A385Z6K2_9PSED|nr:hypothetical protein [Pseudomonas cavernae]AYC33697.1 hypothetical protein D3880_15635 [Pseudomonas cavernae]
MHLSPRSQLAIGLVLALLLAVTRGQHFATVNLPSASWAVFFLAGVLLKPRWVFPALFLEATALDFSMVALGTVDDWCTSPAYWILVPAYAALWGGGRLYAGWHRDELRSLAVLALTVLVSALVCHLLSSGGFYFLSGRYPEPTLAAFLPRIGWYYPRFLANLALYVGVATALYIGARAFFQQQRVEAKP